MGNRENMIARVHNQYFQRGIQMSDVESVEMNEYFKQMNRKFLKVG